MFWGIVVTIGLATLFWSWWIVGVGVFLGGGICFYGAKKSFSVLRRYLGGFFVAGVSLLLLYVGFARRAQVNLQGPLTGIVVEQRSSDSWVVEVENNHLLLRSDHPLDLGSEIMFHTTLTKATLPSLSWSKVTVPTFIFDEFAFDQWLAMKKYIGWGFVSQGQLIHLSLQYTNLSFLVRLKDIYKGQVEKVFGRTPTAALMLGLTTGDRSWFSRQEYTTFVESGLVHLLAVSGSNIVYVSLFLGAVLFWIPFYVRMFLIGGGIIVYGIICGADSSVIRAISMGMVGLIATWTGRDIAIRRLLQGVAGGMLLWNPLILWYDLGFLLSFGAVSGIVVLLQTSDSFFSFSHPRWLKSIVRGGLLPTFGATLGVLPVLILWTGKISLSSIGINLFIVPLVPVFLLLGCIFLLGIDFVWIQWLLDWMSEGLFSLASWGSTDGYFLLVSEGIVRLLFVGVFFLLAAALLVGRRTTSPLPPLPSRGTSS